MPVLSFFQDHYGKNYKNSKDKMNALILHHKAFNTLSTLPHSS